MLETTLETIDDETVVLLTPEMLSHLGLQQGDSVFIELSGDRSLQIHAPDSAVAKAIRASEKVMDENRDALDLLSKR